MQQRRDDDDEANDTSDDDDDKSTEAPCLRALSLPLSRSRLRRDAQRVKNSLLNCFTRAEGSASAVDVITFVLSIIETTHCFVGHQRSTNKINYELDVPGKGQKASGMPHHGLGKKLD